MKVLTWNVRGAGEKSQVWEILRDMNPDIALLQEVVDIPEDIKSILNIKIRKAVKKNGEKQKFSTAILTKGAIIDDLSLSSEYDWVNKELNHFDGNIVGCVVELKGYPKLNIISVYSPAWPVDPDKLRDFDVSKVKTQKNTKVWVTDLLWSALKNAKIAENEIWIVGGDYNTSETFDLTFSSGNAETLERMNDIGFMECLKNLKGKLTPTFRNPSDGKILHQIDHLFVTNNLFSDLKFCDIGDEEIIFGNSISDHLPIITEFKP